MKYWANSSRIPASSMSQGKRCKDSNGEDQEVRADDAQMLQRRRLSQ
jgi:hypothetical protein